MDLILDLHLHSHYSRATSKEANLEGLYKWGKIKGINIIGTGDFTHPLWLKELEEKLEPAEPGLYKLKDTISHKIDQSLSQSIRNNLIRFILTVEISNIYSKSGKVRKLHNLIVSPSFKSVSNLNSTLAKIGNLRADGRPILGLDSKELLRISLEIDENNLFIPAHIWTPWFAMFGSKSGFDSIFEAFDELSSEIRVVETGLSSDPYMNWRISELQNITIISNSDAHSPQKLGREATIINCKLDYFDIISGLKTNDQRLVGTIEFFPEEGKYHLDGHRLCEVKLTPTQSKKLSNICPKCKKELTIGVEHRVDDLASSPLSNKALNNKSVEYIIPLVEILSEILGKGTSSNIVSESYQKIYNTFGSEFEILRKVSLAEIKDKGFRELAEAIQNLRAGKIIKEPGYDGVYGVIKVFGDFKDRVKLSGQMSLLE